MLKTKPVHVNKVSIESLINYLQKGESTQWIFITQLLEPYINSVSAEKLELNKPIGKRKITLLHICAENGWDKACKMLLDNGADQTLMDEEGYLPVDAAVRTTHQRWDDPDLIQLFVEDALEKKPQSFSAIFISQRIGKSLLERANKYKRKKVYNYLTEIIKDFNNEQSATKKNVGEIIKSTKPDKKAELPASSVIQNSSSTQSPVRNKVDSLLLPTTIKNFFEKCKIEIADDYADQINPYIREVNKKTKPAFLLIKKIVELKQIPTEFMALFEETFRYDNYLINLLGVDPSLEDKICEIIKQNELYDYNDKNIFKQLIEALPEKYKDLSGNAKKGLQEIYRKCYDLSLFSGDVTLLNVLDKKRRQLATSPSVNEPVKSDAPETETSSLPQTKKMKAASKKTEVNSDDEPLSFVIQKKMREEKVSKKRKVKSQSEQGVPLQKKAKKSTTPALNIGGIINGNEKESTDEANSALANSLHDDELNKQPRVENSALSISQAKKVNTNKTINLIRNPKALIDAAFNNAYQNNDSPDFFISPDETKTNLKRILVIQPPNSVLSFQEKLNFGTQMKRHVQRNWKGKEKNILIYNPEEKHWNTLNTYDLVINQEGLPQKGKQNVLSLKIVPENSSCKVGSLIIYGHTAKDMLENFLDKTHEKITSPEIQSSAVEEGNLPTSPLNSPEESSNEQKNTSPLPVLPSTEQESSAKMPPAPLLMRTPHKATGVVPLFLDQGGNYVINLHHPEGLNVIKHVRILRERKNFLYAYYNGTGINLDSTEGQTFFQNLSKQITNTSSNIAHASTAKVTTDGYSNTELSSPRAPNTTTKKFYSNSNANRPSTLFSLASGRQPMQVDLTTSTNQSNSISTVTSRESNADIQKLEGEITGVKEKKLFLQLQLNKFKADQKKNELQKTLETERLELAKLEEELAQLMEGKGTGNFSKNPH